MPKRMAAVSTGTAATTTGRMAAITAIARQRPRHRCRSHRHGSNLSIVRGRLRSNERSATAMRHGQPVRHPYIGETPATARISTETTTAWAASPTAGAEASSDCVDPYLFAFWSPSLRLPLMRSEISVGRQPDIPVSSSSLHALDERFERTPDRKIPVRITQCAKAAELVIRMI